MHAVETTDRDDAVASIGRIESADKLHDPLSAAFPKPLRRRPRGKWQSKWQCKHQIIARLPARIDKLFEPLHTTRPFEARQSSTLQETTWRIRNQRKRRPGRPTSTAIHNVTLRSRMRTAIRKVNDAVAKGNKEEAQSSYRAAVPMIDTLVNKQHHSPQPGRSAQEPPRGARQSRLEPDRFSGPAAVARNPRATAAATGAHRRALPRASAGLPARAPALRPAPTAYSAMR